jgi:hypothetical protein
LRSAVLRRRRAGISNLRTGCHFYLAPTSPLPGDVQAAQDIGNSPANAGSTMTKLASP